MADFSSRFAPALPLFIDPDDPRYAGMAAGSRDQALRNYAAQVPQGQPPLTGPQRPQIASQQPNIPIQTAQGAPQTESQVLGTAPNSGVVGASPYANQALTGGGGQPIGGLPTQQPAPNLGSPLQPISGPIRPQINPLHLQAIAALLQRYRSLGV